MLSVMVSGQCTVSIIYNSSLIVSPQTFTHHFYQQPISHAIGALPVPRPPVSCSRTLQHLDWRSQGSNHGPSGRRTTRSTSGYYCVTISPASSRPGLFDYILLWSYEEGSFSSCRPTSEKQVHLFYATIFRIFVEVRPCSLPNLVLISVRLRFPYSDLFSDLILFD